MNFLLTFEESTEPVFLGCDIKRKERVFLSDAFYSRYYASELSTNRS